MTDKKDTRDSKRGKGAGNDFESLQSLREQKVVSFNEVKKARKAHAAPSPAGTDTDDGAADMADEGGRYFVDEATGSIMYAGMDAKGKEMAPQWLCSRIDILGSGYESDGTAYRVLKLYIGDPKKGKPTTKVVALPLSVVDSKRCYEILRAKGAVIASSTKAKANFSNYLQQYGTGNWGISALAGWTGKDYTTYLTPANEKLGNQDNNVFFYSDGDVKADAFARCGSLESWQTEVLLMARGNSRLILGLAMAFAAPLMRIMGMEGGGVHLYGHSSKGKTTTGKVALSVYGQPEATKHQWGDTYAGLERSCLLHNDGLLFLDELQQARNNGEEAGRMVYCIGNGKPDERAAPLGGTRKSYTWRVMCLSTGEETLEDFLAKHKKHTAGQAVRLAALRADAGKGNGCFENLHGNDSAAVFAGLLEKAVSENYGTAGAAFIGRLAEEMGNRPEAVKQKITAMMDGFMRQLPENMDGQPQRVAKRFALIAAAIELAGEYGVTRYADDVSGAEIGLQPNEGADAVKQCFFDYLEDAGTVNREKMQLVANAVKWLRDAIVRNRFVLQTTTNPNPESVLNSVKADDRPMLGYVGIVRSTGAEARYCVLPNSFNEMIGSTSKSAQRYACELFTAMGWMEKDNGRNQKTIRLNKSEAEVLSEVARDSARFYVFKGEQPPIRADEAAA